MWKMAAAVRIFRWPGVRDIITNYCGWGTPWCKPTRLRCILLPRADELCKRCKAVRGICSFSGKKRQILQGRDGLGIHWTARAAAYPHVLANRMADVFQDAAFDRVFRQTVRLYPFRVKDPSRADGREPIATFGASNVGADL